MGGDCRRFLVYFNFSGEGRLIIEVFVGMQRRSVRLGG